MTVGKPKLGERIQNWIGANLNNGAEWIGIHIFPRMGERMAEWDELNGTLVNTLHKQGRSGEVNSLLFTGMWYVVTGHRPQWVQDIADFQESIGGDFDTFLENPSAFIGEQLEDAFSQPFVREFSEVMGALVMDPVIGLFESYASNPNPDPHEFSRSFHGFMISLGLAGSAADSILRIPLGNRAPKISELMSQMYWSLGLGFLGWQTLAPLLSSGLQPPLERYYNRLYRPSRFTASQSSDLFALGEWTADQMADYLRDQGWRDADIQTWIKLSYRSLSEGLLWDLYEQGTLTKAEMDGRLRAAGYDPADIPLLYKSHEPEEKTITQKFLISTVKAAFKAGRMSEIEFRAILSEQNYQAQIIDLLIQQLNTERQTEARELSEGNIRLLYVQRVIGRDEAQHYLEGLDYTGEIPGQLIDAWDRQTLPKEARINKSTILEGYTDGVLTRDEAKDLLQRESGFTPDKAELVIKIEEAGRPEAETPVSVRAATLTQIADWVKNGLITRAEVEGRAELERFSTEDRERIVSLMFLAPPEVADVTELPLALLQQAYIFGAITREDLLGRLEGRGLTPEDAELQVRTLELANPEVFGEFPIVLLRQPSVAALQLAFQRGFFDEATFRAKLEAQGYTLDAIEVFIFNAQYQLPADARKPTRGDLLSWLRESIIGRAEFIRRMTEQGYLSTDIDLYLQAEGPALEDTQIADLFVNGFLQPAGFVTLATEAGYTPEEIEEFLLQFEQAQGE